MRNDFEAVASALIEVDPYRRSNKSGGTPRTVNVSAIDFSAGRGKTGVISAGIRVKILRNSLMTRKMSSGSG